MNVDIVQIATNRYIDYWRILAPQLDMYAFPGSKLTLHVLTDANRPATELQLKRARVQHHPVPSVGWPDATLLRYQWIRELSHELSSDIVMYLDVDMAVTQPFGSELDPEAWRGGIALTPHPGYRHDPLSREVLKLIPHPRAFTRRLGQLASGQRFPGSWETRPESAAYVPPEKRCTYVHGAVWMGLREPLLQMCSTLADRTKLDASRGVMAIWHDESHLNWFAASSEVSYLPTAYSGAADEQGVKIVSVVKPKGFRAP